MRKTNKSSSDLNFEKIWSLFQESEKRLRETERIIKEAFQETDRKFQETDRKFQETDRRFQETDKKIRQLENLFVGQWGKLIEALVEGELIRILRERNINVIGIAPGRYKIFEGKEYEFDIIAENGDEVVVVEVKTSLSQKDIDHFIDKLKKFHLIFPEYKNRKIYGAVAYIRTHPETTKYAYRKGLFVIRAVGENAKILNDSKFKPQNFNIQYPSKKSKKTKK
ncbi:MAG: hypothetical protein D6799_05450 [Bacteroidetes bacterium]|nr:MAG: hypothetical protein D6799_05450 [Bacteroidota bacterium]